MDLARRVDDRRRGTYVLAGLLVLAMVWWPVVRGRRVPVLGWIDLALHEAGHVFFLWAPTDVMLAMGNGFQAGLPLFIALVFLWHERDLAGAGVGFAWVGENLFDAAVYVADAPFRRLPLLGPEDSHDWWQLLGRHGWLEAADELAAGLRVLGLVAFAGAVVTLAVGWRDEAAPSVPVPAAEDREPVPVTVNW